MLLTTHPEPAGAATGVHPGRTTVDCRSITSTSLLTVGTGRWLPLGRGGDRRNDRLLPHWKSNAPSLNATESAAAGAQYTAETSG
jgi:hypothetical protein